MNKLDFGRLQYWERPLIITYENRELNISDFIHEMNYRAGKHKIAFIAEGMVGYLDRINSITDVPFSIKWTGYMFEFYNASKVTNQFDSAVKTLNEKTGFKVPTITKEALYLFLSGLGSDISLYSDTVATFRDVATGVTRRFPKGYWNHLDQKESEMLIKYFIRFCCGFNKYNIIELKMTNVIKWKILPLMLGRNKEQKSYTLYDMANIAFPGMIDPWQMIFVSKGTYQNETTRMAAIKYVMDEYNIETIGELTSTMLQAYTPGILGYYNRIGGMKALRKDYIITTEASNNGK